MGKTLEELIAELEKKARERMDAASETVPEPDATVYEDSGATVYEDSVETMPEDSNATVPETETFSKKPVREPASGIYEKGQTLLDTYKVESDPIHGGMGSVWRVHHNNWNVDLAMKRPQAKLFQSEAQKENFISECEAWINLGLHPNIVSCYYVREIGGVPTIFSEWMENGSLENHIQKGTLYAGPEQEQQERLLDIAVQFARGLHYAHEQGLIHQDVKPDNVLLSKGWDAKVADFGLAKARAQLTVLEGENTVLDAGATVMASSGGYTPAYCSMEQMDGKPLTRRTDIYSWAVSVMEMYLGERLWDNGVVAGYACESYFPGCRVQMPEELKALLKKCMAAQPQDRPHDFAEIETELQSIYKSQTGEEYPRPVPKAASDTADSLNNRALSYIDLGKEEEAESLWEQAAQQNANHMHAQFNYALYKWRHGEIDDRVMLSRCETLGVDNGMPSRKELAAAIHLERGDIDSAALLVGGEDNLHISKAEIERLREYARDDVIREVPFYQLYDISVLFDDEVLTFLPADRETSDPKAFDKLFGVFTWSHSYDKAVMRGADSSVLRILDMDTAAFSDSFMMHDTQVNAAVFSRDDSLIATGDNNGCVKTWDMQTHSCIWQVSTGETTIRSLCFTPDGKYLYCGGFSGTIRIFDAYTGTQTGAFVSSIMGIDHLSVSEDGSRLISGNYKLGQIWDTKTRQCLRTLFEECCTGDALISHNGMYAAVRDKRGYGQTSDKFHIKRVPELCPKAEWLLCKVTESIEQIKTDEVYTEYVEKAMEYLENGRPEEALDAVERARLLPGKKEDELLLDIRAEAGARLGRGALLNVFRQQDLYVENARGLKMFITPDSQKLVLLSQSSIKTYSLSSHKLLSQVEISYSDRILHGGCMDTVGKYLFLFNKSGKAILKIEIASGKTVLRMDAEKMRSKESANISHLRVSECGKYLLAAASNTDCVGIYRTDTGKFVMKLTVDNKHVCGCGISCGGAYAIATEAPFWNDIFLPFKRPIPPEDLVGGVGYPINSRFDTFISREKAVGDERLNIRYLSSPEKPCASIRLSEKIKIVSFTPDDRHIIMLMASGLVTLWSVNGEKECDIIKLDAYPQGMCISPNGRYLVVQQGNDIIHMLELEWEILKPDPTDTDKVLPYLRNFRKYMPYYSPADLTVLERRLSNLGYGWLRGEELNSQLLIAKRK